MLKPCRVSASCVQQEDAPLPAAKGPVGGAQAIGESCSKAITPRTASKSVHGTAVQAKAAVLRPEDSEKGSDEEEDAANLLSDHRDPGH